MAGFIKVRISLYVRRVVTMIPALAVLALGVSPTSALILSQVVLAFGIPFALIPLVLLTSRRDVMGVHVNSRAHHPPRVGDGRPDHRAQRVPALRAAVRLRAGQEACARSSSRAAVRRLLAVPGRRASRAPFLARRASSRSRPRCEEHGLGVVQQVVAFDRQPQLAAALRRVRGSRAPRAPPRAPRSSAASDPRRSASSAAVDSLGARAARRSARGWRRARSGRLRRQRSRICSVVGSSRGSSAITRSTSRSRARVMRRPTQIQHDDRSHEREPLLDGDVADVRQHH